MDVIVVPSLNHHVSVEGSHFKRAIMMPNFNVDFKLQGTVALNTDHLQINNQSQKSLIKKCIKKN